MHSFYETTLRVISKVAGIDYDLLISGAPFADALDITQFVIFLTTLLFISATCAFVLACLSTKNEAKEGWNDDST